MRSGGALPRLEGDHQVDVTRRTVRLKCVDEILSEYRDEQLLKLHVHAWKNTNKLLTNSMSTPGKIQTQYRQTPCTPEKNTIKYTGKFHVYAGENKHIHIISFQPISNLLGPTSTYLTGLQLQIGLIIPSIQIDDLGNTILKVDGPEQSSIEVKVIKR